MQELKEIAKTIPDRLIAWGKFMKFLDSLPENERKALWDALDRYYFTIGIIALFQKELEAQMKVKKDGSL
ncbi:MAG TPA: hypothetical protein ENG51_00830 [Deltaproteobacteria bacterium]|nr:hypothetical protein [Deltaproteobacteria bacterium]